MRPLVVDTDIGTDVDDLMVLAMLPQTPELEPVLVTTVYGDVNLRRDIAGAACRILGLSVPLAAGLSTPLGGGRVFWAGHEGEGIIDSGDRSVRLDAGGNGNAVEAVIKASRTWSGHLEILAIAPLTNLASALLEDPSMTDRIRALHVMGGDFTGALEQAEHNFACDPRAAQIVTGAGVPIVLCGFDSTSRIMFGPEERDRIAASGPAGRLVADQMTRFWDFIDEWAPPEHRGGNMPHDPLALLTMLEPDLFELKPVRVEVFDDGRTGVTPDPASPTRIVSDFDPDAAAERILSRLAP